MAEIGDDDCFPTLHTLKSIKNVKNVRGDAIARRKDVPIIENSLKDRGESSGIGELKRPLSLEKAVVVRIERLSNFPGRNSSPVSSLQWQMETPPQRRECRLREKAHRRILLKGSTLE